MLEDMYKMLDAFREHVTEEIEVFSLSYSSLADHEYKNGHGSSGNE